MLSEKSRPVIEATLPVVAAHLDEAFDGQQARLHLLPLFSGPGR